MPPFAGANINFDPTTHQGVLFDVRYAISSAINLSGGYTYTDAGFDSGVFAGNAISGVAENSARMSVNYQFSKTLNINLGAAYVGSRYLDGDNANLQSKTSGHTVLNSNILYSYQDWKVGFKINNITNRKYFESANSFGSIFPLPERNISLSALWQFR